MVGCKRHIGVLQEFVLFFRKRRREGEREGEKHQCERETLISCLLHNPNWGLNLQPRHVPLLGIELVTSCFVG